MNIYVLNLDYHFILLIGFNRKINAKSQEK